MMIKVKILNLKNFLKAVNQCSGRVLVLSPDGTKTDINGRFTAQCRLRDQYEENRKCLPLTLDFDRTEDYFRIVSYYAGDC